MVVPTRRRQAFKQWMRYKELERKKERENKKQKGEEKEEKKINPKEWVEQFKKDTRKENL